MRPSARIVSLASLWALLTLPLQPPCLAGTPLGSFDKQSHAIIGFQAQVTFSRVLERTGASRPWSIAGTSAAVLSASLLKEAFYDSSFDPMDVWVSLLGSGLGALTLATLPLSLEAEGGLIYLLGVQGDHPDSAPPSSTEIHAQTTFWVARRLGIHLFSGGMIYSGDSDTSRRMLFGLGVRVPIYPLFSRPEGQKRKLAAWLGADSGFFFFAPNENPHPFASYAHAPMYSLGIQWWPRRSAWHVAAQASVVPYPGSLLLGTSLQLGVAL